MNPPKNIVGQCEFKMDDAWLDRFRLQCKFYNLYLYYCFKCDICLSFSYIFQFWLTCSDYVSYQDLLQYILGVLNKFSRLVWRSKARDLTLCTYTFGYVRSCYARVLYDMSLTFKWPLGMYEGRLRCFMNGNTRFFLTMLFLYGKMTQYERILPLCIQSTPKSQVTCKLKVRQRSYFL